MPLTRSSSQFIRRNMDRIRRSFRESFRRRGSKEQVTETSKPHEWQQDEAAVRAGMCNFHVKYLGCVEVFESRGMQVCEEALKALRAGRKRRVRGILYVSGDGLRVADFENKGLIVDQTIEKVSFCAPDRNHERGFAYICRDGTTRRWMCHGFHAIKESGERLSHAVGCAFAVCLEKKQRRDREAACSMTSLPTSTCSQPTPTTATASVSLEDTNRSASATPPGAPMQHQTQAPPQQQQFQRQGSFRQAPLTDRILDPQNVKPAEKPPLKPVVNPHAVARPHGNATLFERQGSLRAAPAACPFKRANSLRVNELPSTLERQRELNGYGQTNKISLLPPPIAESDFEQCSSQMDLSGDAALHGLNQLSLDHSLAQGSGAGTASPALSTASSSRSRADEWLESVASTAAGQQNRSNFGQLPQQYINRTVQPVATAEPAVGNNWNSCSPQYAPPPLASTVVPASAGIFNGLSNTVSFEMFPASTTQTQHSVTIPLNNNYNSNSNGNSGFVMGLSTTVTPPQAVDVFGQPVFSVPPVPERPAYLRNSQSLQFNSTAVQPSSQQQTFVDPFEAKWQAIGGASPRHINTNPFTQESSAVNI